MTTTRKLYSRKGTLLGTITFPDWMDENLIRHGSCRFFLHQPMSLDENLQAQVSTASLTCRTGALVKSWRHADAVELYGVTLEEFEQQRGCAFAPGAGYLRSLME